MVETTVEPAREERDQILEELSRMSDDFTKWANRLDRGVVDEEQFEHHNRTLLNWKEKLQSRLEEEGLGEYGSVEVNLQEVQSALSGFGELWVEGTLEERKALMAERVVDLRVTKDKVTLKLRFMQELEIPIKYGR